MARLWACPWRTERTFIRGNCDDRFGQKPSIMLRRTELFIKIGLIGMKVKSTFKSINKSINKNILPLYCQGGGVK